MALLGVAYATKSFQDEAQGKPHPHKVPLPTHGNPQGQTQGRKPNLREAYEHLIRQAASVESDTTLTEEQKKHKLAALHHELTKLVHGITGVPKELIGRQLPNEDAEALRQEFLKEVDEIIKSTTMSEEEKKEAIGLARDQFRESLTSVQPTQQSPAKPNKQMMKAMESRARADVLSKMKKTMSDPTISKEERQKQFMEEMKVEMHRLKQQYMKHGKVPKPPQGGHGQPQPKKKVTHKRK